MEVPCWQVGILEGAADWDENWDKFEAEELAGFTFVKELTLDVQNVIAPPKQKSLPVQNKSDFRDESSTTVSSLHTNDKSERFPATQDRTSDDESAEQHKDNSVKTDSPDSIKATDSPSKIFQDFPAEVSLPHAVKNQSESVFSGERTFDEPGMATFDSHYDSESAWDFTTTNYKDMDQESLHGNMLFESSDSWGLNPIRTEVPKKSTFTFDSVPGTPAYSYAGSPPGNNMFHNQGPFSAFVDSVPSTPAYSNAGSPRRDSQRPFSSAFADSVPSTPMFASDGAADHSFDNLSRFDSFSSSTPRDGGLFPPRDSSRFDSFHSTTQDAEVNQGVFPPHNFTRFDSMHSTTDSDFGHSLFQPHESFSRFDSMRSTTDSDLHRGFDDDLFGSSDPSRSHDQFKSETSRRESADSWKAF